MNLQFGIAFLSVVSFVASAETRVKLFVGSDIVLPSECYFVLRGDNNDFTCPSSGDPFRTINFPDVANYESGEFSKHLESIIQSATKNGEDLLIRDYGSLSIDGKEHYLATWTFNGQTHQDYTVCDYRSCISVSALDVGFVRDIVEQFSSSTMYETVNAL